MTQKSILFDEKMAIFTLKLEKRHLIDDQICRLLFEQINRTENTTDQLSALSEIARRIEEIQSNG